MKLIKRLLLIITGFYLIALGAVYVLQRNFIYFPNPDPAAAEFLIAHNLEAINISVPDVGEVTSIYQPPPGTDEPVILFFHGNGGSAHERVRQFADFQIWGVGFLAVEYPGYAGNPGRSGEEAFFNSALAHYDWLIEQGIKPEQIVIYGNSLGGASAVHVAHERRAAALILTAPFVSALAMARRRMPYFPTGLLLKDKFRSDLKMPDVEEPLLVLHGDLDRVVPHEMGQALAEMHTGDSRFVSIPGGYHYMWDSGMPDYIREAVFKYAAPAEP